jgi:hypothetical protein
MNAIRMVRNSRIFATTAFLSVLLTSWLISSALAQDGTSVDYSLQSTPNPTSTPAPSPEAGRTSCVEL